jgi:hypothetical protein
MTFLINKMVSSVVLAGISTFLLPLCAIPYPPTALVEELRGKTAILRLYPEAGQVLDYPTDGLVSNSILYSIREGEVKARLRLLRKTPPRLETEILSGRVERGDPILLSLSLSWEHLFTRWDAGRIAAYYRGRVEERSAHLLDLEISRVASAMGIVVKDDFRTETGVEAFLARTMDSLSRKDAFVRKAWQRFGLLLYRHYVLGQNIAGSLDLFLDGETIPATLDDALFLRASLRAEQGRSPAVMEDLGRIIDRKRSVAQVMKSTLMLARLRLASGDTHAALQYLRAISEDPQAAAAGVYQDEARLDLCSLLTELGDLSSARKTLPLIRRDPGNPGVLARIWYLEYAMLRKSPGSEADAVRLKEGFEASFPDSPLLSEFEWLDACDATNRSALSGFRRFEALGNPPRRSARLPTTCALSGGNEGMGGTRPSARQ